MVLVIIGGIYMAAHLPGSISLVPAVVLLVLAILCSWSTSSSLPGSTTSPGARSAWSPAGRSLAYLVIAGMIEYAFIYDGTRGNALIVLIGMLAVFAIAVPLLLGFSVARFQPAGSGFEQLAE